MEFLKKLDTSFTGILKMFGLAILGFVLVAIALNLAGLAVRTVINPTKQFTSPSYYGSTAMNEMAADMDGASLSYRNVGNIAVPPPQPGEEYQAGDDAEAFEITEYTARIKSGRVKDTCAQITALKPRTDVIFEQSNEYDQGCSYRFKVKNESAADVLTVIEGLDPEQLNTSTETIKRQIEDYTDRLEVLEAKRQSIDETLANAVEAYDEVTALATQARDVESMATVIDNKINLIERLTQERININNEIDRLQRSKADQLDRLEYTYFNVSVYEDKLVDVDNLKESWRYEWSQFVSNLNATAQNLSVNLVEAGFKFVEFAIYFLLLLLVVKYGWRATLYLWKK